MKFISKTTKDGSQVEFSLPLDTDLLRNIKKENHTDITFEYAIPAVHNVASGGGIYALPFDLSDSQFVAVITSNDIYLYALLFADCTNSEYEEYEYIFADGMAEFTTVLSDGEKIALTLKLLQSFM